MPDNDETTETVTDNGQSNFSDRLSCSNPLHKWCQKQYDKIQDFVIENNLYKGCDPDVSHADIVIELAKKTLAR
jgi:hypothetical protein